MASAIFSNITTTTRQWRVQKIKYWQGLIVSQESFISFLRYFNISALNSQLLRNVMRSGVSFEYAMGRQIISDIG